MIDDWFTSYYDHPYFSQPPESRTRDFKALHPRFPDKSVRPSSKTNRTAEETAAITDPTPVMRSEIAFYFTVCESTLYEQYESVIASTSSLPNLKISVVDGTRTVWNIIWAAWEIAKDLDKWRNEEIGRASCRERVCLYV